MFRLCDGLAAAAVVGAVAFGVLSFQQVRVWHDDLSLLVAQQMISPTSGTTLVNLGMRAARGAA